MPRIFLLALGLAAVPRLDIRAAGLAPLACLVGIIGWSVVSLAWSPEFYGAMTPIALVVLFALVFVASASLDPLDRDRIMFAFCCGLCVSGAAMLVEESGWGIARSGLFFNREIMAETAVFGLLWSIGRRQWPFVVILSVMLILCEERLALAIACAGALYLLVPDRRILFVGLALALVAAVAAVLELKIGSSFHRLTLWGAAILSLDPVGRGVGWWFQAHPFGGEEYAHSDLLQSGVEIGFAGLLWPLFFALVWLRGSGDKVWRACFLAGVAEFALSFPTHLPAQVFAFALAAGGVACRVRLPHGVGFPRRTPDAERSRWQWSHGGRISRGSRSSAGVVSVRSAFAQYAAVGHSSGGAI